MANEQRSQLQPQQLKQGVTPPPTLKDDLGAEPTKAAITSTSWFSDAENQLLAAGWSKAGLDQRGLPTFSDPNGSPDGKAVDLVDGVTDSGRPTKVWKPRKTERVVLKDREGNVSTIEQVVGPPCAWTYPIEQAVAVMKNREAHRKAS